MWLSVWVEFPISLLSHHCAYALVRFREGNGLGFKRYVIYLRKKFDVDFGLTWNM